MNNGNATQQDVVNLIEIVKNMVLIETKETIEPEIEIVEY